MRRPTHTAPDTSSGTANATQIHAVPVMNPVYQSLMPTENTTGLLLICRMVSPRTASGTPLVRLQHGPEQGRRHAEICLPKPP